MERLSFSSDHVNYLILRYLQESRFSHSAYTFAHECSLGRDAFEPGEVPPGALIHLIQKGLQFVEMEANVSKEGIPLMSEYAFIDSKDLITKDVEQLRRDVRVKRERLGVEDGRSAELRNDGDAAMDDVQAVAEVTPDQIISLKGHTSEVFTCSWSPTDDVLATGYGHFSMGNGELDSIRARSGDSSARVWSSIEERSCDPVVLQHDVIENGQPLKNKDVTSLDWSPEGDRLATGSYDGIARIWSRTGELLAASQGHRGPVFSIKWNSSGTSLLTGSVDKLAIVWDGQTGNITQRFPYHSGKPRFPRECAQAMTAVAAVLDVDWKDDVTFASCSTDRIVFLCELGSTHPIRAFHGHQDEVNAVKWDPQGRLLATCSDDATTRVWSLKQESPLLILEGHSKEIYTVRWSPTSTDTENVIQPQLIASASFDTTIKLWDLESGKCRNDLTRHSMSVYSVAFSPDGRFLASGSFDKRVLIWNVADGRLVKSFTGRGGIYEVCWNRDGTKVAACSNNKIVSVMNIRM